MRAKDLKKIGLYIKSRLLDGPIFSKQKFATLTRYIKEGFSLIWDKLHGLDFVMVYYTSDVDPHKSSYSKAPKYILKRIFEDTDFSEEKNFIDIGCGKGYVISQASKYPFNRVGGVEYQPYLYDVCIRNLKKMKIDSSGVSLGDARDFEDYGRYNVYFMNNPFDETILRDVAKKIVDAHKDDGCRIYYLNPHYKERQQAILDAGFVLEKRIPDGAEPYFDVNVYVKKV